MRRLILLGAGLVLAASQACAAEFHYEDYKPARLAEPYAIGEKECAMLDKNVVALVGGKEAFRVAAVWNGEARPIAERMSALLYLYEKTRGLPYATREIFKTEVKVSDDAGRAYWLPIQELILGAFKDEVGPVKRTTLYVVYLGCLGEQVAVTINEFQAGQN